MEFLNVLSRIGLVGISQGAVGEVHKSGLGHSWLVLLEAEAVMFKTVSCYCHPTTLLLQNE